MAFLNKAKKIMQCSTNNRIYRNYYDKGIDEKLVYVESMNGEDFTGNVFRIVEELSTGKYGSFKIFVYANKDVHPKINELKKNYNLKIKTISADEIKATKTLEIAKYIITDSYLRPKFVKRPEQVMLNTWCGTPFQTMGIDNQSEEHLCADIQQVFFASDYLLASSNYMKEKVLNAYMLEKIYPGTVLIGGNPRNSVLFNENRELKAKLGLEDKEIFAYVPSHGNGKTFFKEIDAKLNDNQILLVKSNGEFSNFKHIRAFPRGYESYDILNISDCLVTDCSSALFDYANTKKKIIIFNPGTDFDTYIPLSSLPFPEVHSADDLISELNSGKDYDDSDFINEFCSYDNSDACVNLCRHIFNGDRNCLEEKIKTDKKNVLIFSGGLKNNGMTSSMINVLSNIDLDEFNVFICYSSWDPYLHENHAEAFGMMPEGIEYCPLRMGLNFTVSEHREFVKFLSNPNSKLSKPLENMFKRELHRAFNGFPFDSIIHFNGYGIEETMLFSVSDAKKSIWVHNDMVQEMQGKDNQNRSVLRHVYNEYDNVCVVSPDLVKPTSEISGRTDNIRIVHNVNNISEIEKKGQRDLEINDSCVITTRNPDGIDGVLNSSGRKFITIGRFSPEKGHDRLIRAFNRYCEDYPDSQLIIIGGYGPSYDETLGLAEESKFADNITIVRSILNPMPILKQCDLFVVSSYYEGWPMVIMEADAFDIPIIATDITGTQWTKDYGSHIVENSEDGILQGMHDFTDGNVEALGIDYEEYNKKAIEEFLEVI